MIAFVQKKMVIEGGGNQITFDSQPGVGNLIVVSISSYLVTVAQGDVTDNQGNTYTRIATAVETEFGENHIAMFYAKNIASSGTFTITANNSSSIVAVEYSGADTSSPLDNSNTATGTSNNPSVSVSTSVANTLLVGAEVDGSDESPYTAGSGFTMRETQLDTDTHTRIGVEDLENSGASGTKTIDMTLGSTPGWAIIGAAFKVAAGTTTSTSTTTTSTSSSSTTSTSRTTSTSTTTTSTSTSSTTTSTSTSRTTSTSTTTSISGTTSTSTSSSRTTSTSTTSTTTTVPLLDGSLSGLTYRSIDTMKNNKDNMRDQVSDTFIERLVYLLATQFNITHIAIAIPLDSQQDWIDEGVTLPSPRTTEGYTQKWCDEIHAMNKGVKFRGAFCGMEGIYDFTHRVGPSNRYPAGDPDEVLGTIFDDDYQRSSIGDLYTTSGAWSIIGGELVSGAPVSGWAGLCKTVRSYKDFTATSKIKYQGATVQMAFRTDATQGYGAQIRGDDGGVFRLERWGLENLAQVSKTLVSGTYYDVKVTCSGSSIKCKMWVHGTTEPATWDIEVTDATYSEGAIGFSSETDTQIFDDLYVVPVPIYDSWLGKIALYILNNPGFFRNGDRFDPMPERTEGIFDDNTAFLPNTGDGIQANYANFFINVKTVADACFSQIGKPGVITGLSAQNYSEVNSGWLPQSMFAITGIQTFDHYGITHTPEELATDYDSIYNSRGWLLAHSEWGDYWNGSLTNEERVQYLRSIYNVMADFLDQGKLVELNYWGGWADGAGEQILTMTGSVEDPTFGVAYNGVVLQQYLGPVGAITTTSTSSSSSSSTTSTSITHSTTSTSTTTTLAEYFGFIDSVR